MGGRNHIVQCVELIETDKIYIRNLSIVIFLLLRYSEQICHLFV